MNDDLKAVLYTLVDSVTYSLVPVLAAISIGKIDAIPYFGLAVFVSVITYILYFSYKKVFSNFRVDRKILIYSFVGGVGFALSHMSLIYSINNSDNMILPSIIFQIYPLIIMIILVNLNMSKEIINKGKIFIIFLAVLGIVILNYDKSISNGHVSIISIVIPIFSALLLAVSVSYTIKLSNYLDEVDGEWSPILANFYSKVVSFIVMIPFGIWYLLSDKTMEVTWSNMAIILVYGSLVLTIGTIYYYKGVRITTKSLSIHLISYISAILTVLWLWLLDYGTMTATALIGSAFILSSITMLHFNVEKNYAYNGSIIWTLFIGVFIYFYESESLNDYYEAIAVPLVFFAVSLAFLMDRIFKRTDEEEKLVVAIINESVENDNSPREFIDTVIKLSTTRVTDSFSTLYEKAKMMDISSSQRHLLNKYVLSKVQRLKFSEIFVLFLTAILTLYVTIFYNPGDSMFNDIFKLGLSTAIIFNLLYIYDNEKERSKDFIFIDYSNGDSVPSINMGMNSSQTITERFIAIVLLFFIILLFYFVYTIG